MQTTINGVGVSYRLPATVTVVNPEIKRGIPPRPVYVSDLIQAPVKQAGTFTLMDMLSDASIQVAITFYTDMKKKAERIHAPMKRAR